MTGYKTINWIFIILILTSILINFQGRIYFVVFICTIYFIFQAVNLFSSSNIIFEGDLLIRRQKVTFNFLSDSILLIPMIILISIGSPDLKIIFSEALLFKLTTFFLIRIKKPIGIAVNENELIFNIPFPEKRNIEDINRIKLVITGEADQILFSFSQGSRIRITIDDFHKAEIIALLSLIRQKSKHPIDISPELENLDLL
jgi:hypothetical protein